MAAPAAALAASQPVTSPAVRYLVAAIISAPVLFVVMLLMLLGGGTAADAAAAPAASAVSPSGAQGLSQFLPGAWLGESIDGDGDGIVTRSTRPTRSPAKPRSCADCLPRSPSDASLTGDPIDLTLASYNAGLGAVQRYHGVPPYAETQGYITRIRTLMATDADPTASAAGAGPPGRWVRPIQGAPITSGFSYRLGRLHTGIDFGAPIGTPVRATAASDGTVIAAGPASGFGQWGKIQHPGNVTTVYGHIRGCRHRRTSRPSR